MIRRHSFRSQLLITGVAGAAIAAAAAIAPAHSHDATSAFSYPSAGSTAPGDVSLFTLNDAKSAAVLRYAVPHELRICNDTGPVPGAPRTTAQSIDPLPPSESPLDWPLSLRRPASTAVTLRVRHSGTTDDVTPGACDMFRAKRVLIGSARPLTPGSTLHGTVQSVSPYAEVPSSNSTVFGG